jgi:hypothetical protein
MRQGGLRNVKKGDEFANAHLPGVPPQHDHDLKADRIA